MGRRDPRSAPHQSIAGGSARDAATPRTPMHAREGRAAQLGGGRIPSMRSAPPRGRPGARRRGRPDRRAGRAATSPTRAFSVASYATSSGAAPARPRPTTGGPRAGARPAFDRLKGARIAAAASPRKEAARRASASRPQRCARREPARTPGSRPSWRQPGRLSSRRPPRPPPAPAR